MLAMPRQVEHQTSKKLHILMLFSFLAKFLKVFIGWLNNQVQHLKRVRCCDEKKL